jgi:hypothetical protein
MSKRPAVTLIEVLIAVFVTAVGLLALLALFPIGALSMYQAIKDSRCAQAAINGNGILNSINPVTGQQLRTDPAIAPTAPIPPLSPFLGGPAWNLPGPLTTGPGYPVYVDPIGFLAGSNSIGNLIPGIPRVSPSFITSVPQCFRWFSLADDLTFAQNGTVSVSSSNLLEREDRYTWAYMMHLVDASKVQTGTWLPSYVNCTIVVYSGRPQSVVNENVYQNVSLAANSNTIQLNYGGSRPSIRAGGWVLDATVVDATGAVDPHGDFYRVVSVTDDPVSANTVNLELQTPIKHNSTAGVIIVMEGVAEVFEKSTGIP